ncbi:heme exporter protein CcmD [Thaumasiovibrio sp. DFM-14]|uniref:heme exporter protein CcmD n=1 Tax=Thaumasiovibrio sp. DFM-14 TaxID=3384792 RepID=UPI0039A3EFEC
MQFNSFSEFFAMGGYAAYVWFGVGGAVLALATTAWVSRQQHKKALDDIRAQKERETRIKAAKQMENTL